MRSTGYTAIISACRSPPRDVTGTAAAPPPYTTLGFPGQTKILSDVYYNRYRDYDSSLGRYIQADPIGPNGGSNPSLYAKANPLRWTDDVGLQAQAPTCHPLVKLWYDALKSAACNGPTGPRRCNEGMSTLTRVRGRESRAADWHDYGRLDLENGSPPCCGLPGSL